MFCCVVRVKEKVSLVFFSFIFRVGWVFGIVFGLCFIWGVVVKIVCFLFFILGCFYRVVFRRWGGFVV